MVDSQSRMHYVLVTMTSYQVINRRTNQVFGTYTSLSRARAARDKRDLAYGAAVHVVKAVVPA